MSTTRATTPRPSYGQKGSNNQWMRTVPEHWDTVKIRNILNTTTERNRPDLPLLSVVREKGVILRDLEDPDENHNVIPEDLTNYKVVRKGQFAMNKMKAWQGSYGVSGHEGIVSPAYFIFDLRGVNKDFFHIAIRSRAYVPFFTQASDGVRIGQWDLSLVRMREIPFLIPPHDEQDAIVRYLDDAEQRIRAYVSAKERLIALLEEERQAVIHQAVTRGLDPNVKLKSSGVEWLGEVPEHWDVWRIKQVSGILRGKFTHRPRNDPSLYDGPYPFIQTGDIAGTNKMLSGYKQTLNDNGFAVSKMFPKGTLVMTIAANIGDVAVLDFDACFPDSVVGFVPGVRVDRDYLYYLFLAMKNELLREAPVNTQGNLNVDRIGSRTTILPQIGEQTDIVNHVEQSVSNIDSAMDHARRQIELMEEYRTRLIADVVTGKIDVTRTQARTGALGQSPEFQPIKQKWKQRANDE